MAWILLESNLNKTSILNESKAFLLETIFTIEIQKGPSCVFPEQFIHVEQNDEKSNLVSATRLVEEKNN